MMAVDASILSVIHHAATAYGLPAPLLQAQVLQESGGDPFAFRYEPAYFRAYIRRQPSAKGWSYGPLAACSFGLLQILLETALEQGFTGRPEDLFEASIGLSQGCQYLASLWKLAGQKPETYRVAVAAYNGGPKILDVPETSWPIAVQGYVSGVYAKVTA